VQQFSNRILALLLISFLSLLLPFGIAGLADEAAFVPLTIDNKVLPSSGKNFLTDPRVFNAEFYRKFNPQLKLADDDAAKRESLHGMWLRCANKSDAGVFRLRINLSRGDEFRGRHIVDWKSDDRPSRVRCPGGIRFEQQYQNFKSLIRAIISSV
jgi:hypothetical protein